MAHSQRLTKVATNGSVGGEITKRLAGVSCYSMVRFLNPIKYLKGMYAYCLVFTSILSLVI